VPLLSVGCGRRTLRAGCGWLRASTVVAEMQFDVGGIERHRLKPVLLSGSASLESSDKRVEQSPPLARKHNASEKEHNDERPDPRFEIEIEF